MYWCGKLHSTLTKKDNTMQKGKIILGVTKSDSHVVANRLIKLSLVQHGYDVINLGVCTPISDFMDAYSENQDAICIAIGNLNGHVIPDTRELSFLKKKYRVRCPVIIGGSPYSKLLTAPETQKELLETNGFDHIITSTNKLINYLDRLIYRTHHDSTSLMS